jgi:hypothetical protein
MQTYEEVERSRRNLNGHPRIEETRRGRKVLARLPALANSNLLEWDMPSELRNRNLSGQESGRAGDLSIVRIPIAWEQIHHL